MYVQMVGIDPLIGVFNIAMSLYPKIANHKTTVYGMRSWYNSDLCVPVCYSLIAKDIMDTRLSCIGLKPKVRDVEHMIRSTTHNAFMVVAPLGSSASESTVVISNVPQAHVQEMSTLDRTMHFNEITSVATPAMVDPFEESFGGRSQIQTRIKTYITSVKQQQGGARLNNSSSGTSTMLYSDDIVCPQLRFLGIILRSQLLTLLKYKAYDKPVIA